MANHPNRLSTDQRQMLVTLPRLGQEWLDVTLWGPRSIDRLRALKVRGLVDIWYAPEPHARLTYDGNRLVWWLNESEERED